MPTVEESNNKSIVARFEEALSSGDWRVISETIDEVVAPDAVISTPLPIDATGAELLKAVFGRLLSAFPDLHVTVEDLIAEGDKVVARLTHTGTHLGAFLDLPSTGKHVSTTSIHIFRFADGQLVEHWASRDDMGLMQQLGAIAAKEED